MNLFSLWDHPVAQKVRLDFSIRYLISDFDRYRRLKLVSGNISFDNFLCISTISNNLRNKFSTQKIFMKSVPLQRKILRLFLTSLVVMTSLAIAAPSTARITIRTFAPYYSPTLIRISTSTSISWDNPTGALHSITHDECQRGADCAFDSGPLGPNSTFTIPHLPPGSYYYHCSFHPIMQGILIVQDPDSPSET